MTYEVTSDVNGLISTWTIEAASHAEATRRARQELKAVWPSGYVLTIRAQGSVAK